MTREEAQKEMQRMLGECQRNLERCVALADEFGIPFSQPEAGGYGHYNPPRDHEADEVARARYDELDNLDRERTPEEKEEYFQLACLLEELDYGEGHGWQTSSVCW